MDEITCDFTKFSTISVISGQCEGDNERCATELHALTNGSRIFCSVLFSDN